MHPISIFLIGIAMSTDAFAAAVGKGAAIHKPRFTEALRAGFIFGTIEGLPPSLDGYWVWQQQSVSPLGTTESPSPCSDFSACT